MELWTKSLLELCADRLHCYISDLACQIIRSNTGFKKGLIYELRKVDADAFPIDEWLEAILYILGEEKTFIQTSDAKEYLIKQLNR